jgi:hypothetical protein
MVITDDVDLLIAEEEPGDDIEESPTWYVRIELECRLG